MGNPRRPKGMITAYLLSEDAAGNVWGVAVFEDEKTYRDNAADPAQGEEYQSSACYSKPIPNGTTERSSNVPPDAYGLRSCLGMPCFARHRERHDG